MVASVLCTLVADLQACICFPTWCLLLLLAGSSSLHFSWPLRGRSHGNLNLDLNPETESISLGAKVGHAQLTLFCGALRTVKLPTYLPTHLPVPLRNARAVNRPGRQTQSTLPSFCSVNQSRMHCESRVCDAEQPLGALCPLRHVSAAPSALLIQSEQNSPCKTKRHETKLSVSQQSLLTSNKVHTAGHLSH